MNVKTLLAAPAVAGLLLVNPGAVRAQDQTAASESGDTTRAIAAASLTQASRNAVEVWRLTCTTTPFLVAQVARARIRDNGGADGRRLYFHLTRQTTGATVKTTAPDGGLSAFAAVGSGGAGSVYFIEVSKDRDGATVLGVPVPEPYILQAECIAGGIVRPHALVLIQNR
jgi:hypothetical protein